jgi:hypothetical protein
VVLPSLSYNLPISTCESYIFTAPLTSGKHHAVFLCAGKCYPAVCLNYGNTFEMLVLRPSMINYKIIFVQLQTPTCAAAIFSPTTSLCVLSYAVLAGSRMGSDGIFVIHIQRPSLWLVRVTDVLKIGPAIRSSPPITCK